MSDLFSLPDPSRGVTDPRPQNVRMEREETTGPRMVADRAEMSAIIEEIVKGNYPPEIDRQRYLEAGHRYSFEDLEFPIADIVGHVSHAHFRWMIAQALLKENEGTHLHTLHRTQWTGVWLPTAVAIRPATVPKMNGSRVAKHRLPSDTIVEDEKKWTEAVATAVDVLQVRIMWTDAANAEAIRFDAKGQPITDPGVRVVSGGTDPALVDAIRQTAEATRAVLEHVVDREARAEGGAPDDTEARRAEHAQKVRDGIARARAEREAQGPKKSE